MWRSLIRSVYGNTFGKVGIFANRVTDDEFQANRSEYERQWRESSPPTVETSIYRVHTDEGNVGIGEGAGISEERTPDVSRQKPL